MALLLAACATTPPPHDSPERALRALDGAIGAERADEVWHALDEGTRNGYRVAWRARRAAAELLSLLPNDDVDVDAATRVRTARAVSPETLFAESVAAADLKRLGSEIDIHAGVLSLVTEARFATRNGEHLVFLRDPHGAWGYAGFADRARQSARQELDLVERLSRLVIIRTLGRGAS